MHWPPTNQWTAALQPYSLLVQILQRCETGDSIGLYLESGCTRNLLMNHLLPNLLIVSQEKYYGLGIQTTINNKNAVEFNQNKLSPRNLQHSQ